MYSRFRVAPAAAVVPVEGKNIGAPQNSENHKKQTTTKNGPKIDQNQYCSTKIDAIDAEKQEESKNNIENHEKKNDPPGGGGSDAPIFFPSTESITCSHEEAHMRHVFVFAPGPPHLRADREGGGAVRKFLVGAAGLGSQTFG